VIRETFWHIDDLCCTREKKELPTGTHRGRAASKIRVGFWEILPPQAVLSQGLFSSVRGSLMPGNQIGETPIICARVNDIAAVGN